jgi:hypothetical protein
MIDKLQRQKKKKRNSTEKSRQAFEQMPAINISVQPSEQEIQTSHPVMETSSESEDDSDVEVANQS